jgi:hypothetical protein
MLDQATSEPNAAQAWYAENLYKLGLVGIERPVVALAVPRTVPVETESDNLIVQYKGEGS